MEMHQVRYFLAVAKHLNFTKAADVLGVTQPSLTRAIQKLESELQGPLFRRERSNTHLTELGRMIAPHFEAALAAADAAKMEALHLRMNKTGCLALGICAGIDTGAVATLLLQSARKSVHLTFSVEVLPPDALERQMIAGQLDAAVLIEGSGNNERFDFLPLREELIVVAFAGDHRFAAYREIGLDMLDGEPLIARCGYPSESVLVEAMNARDRAVIVRHRSNDDACVAAFVREGLGCAVVPGVMAQNHSLTFCKLEGAPFRYRTMLATVSGRRHSVGLAALLCHVRASVPA